MKTWESVMKEAAESVGLWFDTWSPGDGVTRYRFFRDGPRDYFEADGVFTALGRKEAILFIRGAGDYVPFKRGEK